MYAAPMSVKDDACVQDLERLLIARTEQIRILVSWLEEVAIGLEMLRNRFQARGLSEEALIVQRVLEKVRCQNESEKQKGRDFSRPAS
jgi:hypothetical protein